MTPEAKGALSRSIRALRTRLLDDLHAATESAYRLSVRTREAGLDDVGRVRRARLEAWVAEQLRAQGIAGRGKGLRTAEDFRREAEKQAAYTLLNRLVLLRLMETPGPDGTPLRAPSILTGGWESRAYADFRQLAPALARGDETEGYAFLLRLVFEDLALDLPGLYGPAGVADLVPIPPATLRQVVEALNAPELDSCWSDDMTLGWVYQYWNDPEREALDDKLHGGGKVEPHEIASKTQMFTERYMVDWLLQNSLGPLWIDLCRKHGWTPLVESEGTLARLEERRIEWRARREAGTVALTDLMPLHSESERRWAYYLPPPPGAADLGPRPSPAAREAGRREAGGDTRGPRITLDSIRDLRILDPAVGSGHFLVVALDLLLALYREEARHRGEFGTPPWSDRACVEHILSHNLHGIDLDPRAVQIAAAALWLKARQVASDARPERLNLVASNLRLGSLPDNDPALVELRLEVERETGIPGALTDTLIHALRGADHLGSLLKIDHAVDEAIARNETELGQAIPDQGDLFAGFSPRVERKIIDRAEARATLLDRIEAFLARHTGGDDLGLRLRGEQLAAGVRFVRLVREGAYDLVVANPPYQGTSKMADSAYIESAYPLGKADLYAAFLLRGLELVREGGTSSMLTMRNWMFIQQFSGLRRFLLGQHTIRAIGDVSWGAFREMRDNPVAISVISKGQLGVDAIAVAPTDPQERVRTQEEFAKKDAGLLSHVGRHVFDPAALKVVPEWPLVYWWDARLLKAYEELPLLGSLTYVTAGAQTSPKERFIRKPWEVSFGSILLRRADSENPLPVRGSVDYVPYLDGADGACWLEPLSNVLSWRTDGIVLKQWHLFRTGSVTKRVAGEDWYFRPGVAANSLGSVFNGRMHRWQSITGTMGTTCYPSDSATAWRLLLLLNSVSARMVLTSLNPTVHFNVGDVNRLPLFPIADAAEIFARVEAAFAVHESHREPSVEFRCPGPSPWRHVQEWAQAAVDRAEGEPLPEYQEELDPEPPTDALSFALGVALGRFPPGTASVPARLHPPPQAAEDGRAPRPASLPHGLLFLDTTLDATDRRDGLGHPSSAPLLAAWEQHGPSLNTKKELREWLAWDFFGDVHKAMYENRPIHWPLSSSGRTFVAWVNLHRFNGQTLRILLADHLVPTLARIEGELNDLRTARDGADRKAARGAEKQYDRAMKAREELQGFIASVEQCADRGAPPTDPRCPARERDARHAPDLDDGVMINSAALWPLLEPQWKDPKKWWKELATSDGRKDYDWSHLAMRHWPTRVDRKCQSDPSLGVAHGCFWRYHPGRAWAWELRLQDEIGPDFRIEEPPYSPGGRDLGDGGDRPHREAWLRDHWEEALAALEKEAIRRMGRSKNRKIVTEVRLLETGLWTSHPAALWELELRLSGMQGRELRITAPDEPTARAAYEAAHPGKAEARTKYLLGLVPPDWFVEEETEGVEVADTGEGEEG
jgi:hypothetical protein